MSASVARLLTPRLHEMAAVTATEGRIKHAQDVRAGHSNIFEGPRFLGS